jgi:hypothetical protein
LDVGGEEGGDQGADFGVADADWGGVDYEVDGGWVAAWDGGEGGGEEFCDFEGGVDGEAVLEGLWGGRGLLVFCLFGLVGFGYGMR